MATSTNKYKHTNDLINGISHHHVFIKPTQIKNSRENQRIKEFLHDILLILFLLILNLLHLLKFENIHQ